jgi:hypothetical protein
MTTRHDNDIELCEACGEEVVDLPTHETYCPDILRGEE